MSMWPQENAPSANEPRDFYDHEAPDRLQDDPLVSYFRSRYKEREHMLKLETFEKKFEGKKYTLERIKQELERVEQELTRIDELRSEFDGSHGFFMERLRTSRENWKKYAKDNCLNETIEVQKMIEHLAKQSDKKSQKLLSWKRYELDILKRVPNIKLEDLSTESVPPKTGGSTSTGPQPSNTEEHTTPTKTDTSQDDPDHGFMASMITLKKKTPNSSYIQFEMEKYAVNKALDDTWVENPLKQRCNHCESDTLQYFHFPANNMSWIEVCLFSSVPAMFFPTYFGVASYYSLQWRKTRRVRLSKVEGVPREIIQLPLQRIL